LSVEIFKLLAFSMVAAPFEHPDSSKVNMPMLIKVAATILRG
jgi:hypothetical protein